MASRKQYDKAVSPPSALPRRPRGYRRRSATGDLFLPPTVGRPAGRVASRASVRSVLAIHRCAEEEALAIANDTPYGLGGSIWSQDISRALRLARRLDVADVWVNTHYIRHVETPFGGRHLSGLGRELGLAGVEEYLSWKRLCIDTRASFHLKDWFDGPGGRA
jgi:acyl-CoA reductase-like NAD-dependent aldehyde dehydrogenase